MEVIGERGKRHFVYANLLIWNFCKKFVWQINKDEPPAVLSAANYKVIWWKTIKMMFEREGEHMLSVVVLKVSGL